MATTTIGGMTAVTSTNLTGVAVMEVEDANGDSRKATLDQLRNRLFGGGAGFTAADRLAVNGSSSTVGAISVGVNALTGATTMYGVTVDAMFASDVVGLSAAFGARVRTQAAAYTASQVAGLRIADAIKGAGSTITTQYGLYIVDQTQGGTNYAIFTNAGIVRFGDLVSTPASTTTSAGLRIAHGAAPTTPVNGDVWTTTGGMYVRINGVTKQVTLT